RELHEEERKISLAPPGAPVADQRWKEPAIEFGVMHVLLALIPDDAFDPVRDQRGDYGVKEVRWVLSTLWADGHLGPLRFRSALGLGLIGLDPPDFHHRVVNVLEPEVLGYIFVCVLDDDSELRIGLQRRATCPNFGRLDAPGGVDYSYGKCD